MKDPDGTVFAKIISLSCVLNYFSLKYIFFKMCQRAMGIWQITMSINLMKEKLKKLKLVTDTHQHCQAQTYPAGIA